MCGVPDIIGYMTCFYRVYVSFMEPKNLQEGNFLHNQLLENVVCVENSSIIKEYTFSLINQLNNFVAETDVDNIQNTLEQIYDIFLRQDHIDEQTYTQEPSIIQLCLIIFDHTEEMIYIRCLCIRILSTLFNRSPDAVSYMAENDFCGFMSYCFDSNLITIIRPTYHFLSSFFTYEPARQTFLESDLLEKILDMTSQTLFENNMKNRRILEDSLNFLKDFVSYCTFPEHLLVKLFPITDYCVGNRITFTLQSVCIIISKMANDYVDYILNETNTFQQISDLINVFWEKNESLSIVQYAARSLSTLLYKKNDKSQLLENPHLFEMMNPEIIIRIFKRHYKKTTVLNEITILIADLLVKGPPDLASAFFSIDLLGAMSRAYNYASSTEKENFLNLFWLFAKGSSPDQLKELTAMQCFTEMLTVFEYDNDFIAYIINSIMFPVLQKIYILVPIDQDVWTKIREAVEEGLSSDNEDIENTSTNILAQIEKWENETEEERVQHVNELTFSLSKPENIKVPPVQPVDENTFSQLPLVEEEDDE